MISNSDRLRILSSLPEGISVEDRNSLFKLKLQALHDAESVVAKPKPQPAVVTRPCGSCGGGEVR